MSRSNLCLQFDVGNSGAKWRFCQLGEVVASGTYAWEDRGASSEFPETITSVDRVLVSSVASAEKDAALAHDLEQRWGLVPWFAKTQAECAGLKNSYADPSRMGVDRWLAMLGARNRYEGALCVIDAGSALTIDHVRADGQHLGGYIIPGPALMERALLFDTDRVRFDEPAEYALTPGTSTAEAVRHGIALAQAGAVSLALSQITASSVTVVYCGGAGRALMELAGGRGNWHPDLVFEGLEVMASEML